MKRKKYIISFDTAERFENVLKSFILEQANIVRLTRMDWIEHEVGFPKLVKKHYAHDKDPRLLVVLKQLKPYFIKKIRNNLNYDDIPQPNNRQFTHYFFKLTDSLRQMVKEESLYLASIGNPDYSKHFYGFEDPAFYKNDVMIGSVIGHEPMVTLFITEKDKEQLEKQGVKFDTNWIEEKK